MNLSVLFARLKNAASALSAGQLATLTLAFVAVVSLTIGSAYWLNTPMYGVLFSDMDTESAAGVVTRLKADKVPYVIDDGGRAVRVPLNRVDELRLQFASQGMPASGHIGFELFDRTSFGVTDFIEHVNYRRALEGELARTIATISEVAGARVHIALPQPSLFSDRDKQAKASVVLKLRSNRQLAPSTVVAIRGLVSASVESLGPESVVIIDTYGRPLSKTEENAEGRNDGAPFERQERIERDLTTQVVSLLEPIVGAGRVRVNVSAKLKSATEEETEERFDPTPIVRSRQTVSQTASGTTGLTAATAQGVAGAPSNLPPDPSNPEATAVLAEAPPGTHLAETTNYEVSKLTRHSLHPRGDIDRLSVAVVLDDERTTGEDGQVQVNPRTPEAIQKVHGLVAAAVGFDPERGDQLMVENISFEETPVVDAPAPGLWERYGQQGLEVGRIVGIVVIGLVAVFVVIRPMVRSSLAGLPAGSAAGAIARTVQDLEAEIDAQAAGGQPKRMPVLAKRVAALTNREPENAARLLRTWLSEDEH